MEIIGKLWEEYSKGVVGNKHEAQSHFYAGVVSMMRVMGKIASDNEIDQQMAETMIMHINAELGAFALAKRAEIDAKIKEREQRKKG